MPRSQLIPKNMSRLILYICLNWKHSSLQVALVAGISPCDNCQNAASFLVGAFASGYRKVR